MSHVYDLMTGRSVGNVIVRSQINWTNELPAERRALIVGDGTGRFLLELLRRAKPSHVVTIDISETMIRKARQRIQNNDPTKLEMVNFVTADLDALTLKDLLSLSHGNQNKENPAYYDVIATNFFLDLYTERNVLKKVQKLSSVHAINGIYINTDFIRVHGTGLLVRIQRFLLKGLYVLFRLVTRIPGYRPADYDAILKECGYEKLKSRYFAFGMIESSMYRKIR